VIGNIKYGPVITWIEDRAQICTTPADFDVIETPREERLECEETENHIKPLAMFRFEHEGSSFRLKNQTIFDG
jgi:hypothetical protein